MTALLVALAGAVAVAAAIRSTWSPCGLSMLSTITPLAERARGRRYRATAAWFIVGGLVGGATLGVGAAVLAAAVAASPLTPRGALGLFAGAALVCAASDLGIPGFRLPGHTRQVNEVWLEQYRSWVYGFGFGWQIGCGLATFIMTAAVYLTIVAAGLTAVPLLAVALGSLLGLVRGLAILLGARITSTDRLVAFHAAFDRWGERARRATIAVQLGAAAVALGAVWGPGALIGAVAIGALGTAVAVATGHIGRRRRLGATA